jgi:hypothetical protein
MGSASMARAGVILRQVGLIALWLVAALAILEGGTRPGCWERTLGIESYPLGEVLLFLGLSVVELIVAWLIVRPADRPSWRRLAIALIVFVPWAFFSVLLVMHAPGHIVAHAIWMLALVLIIAIALLISGGSAAYLAIVSSRRKLRDGREPSYRPLGVLGMLPGSLDAPNPRGARWHRWLLGCARAYAGVRTGWAAGSGGGGGDLEHGAR